ncbi:MAG: hypothetical protein ACF8Q5_06055 [Phycisphaerales bacterium JB040]
MLTFDYARGQDWYIEARKPHGGFCFIHERSIHAAWSYLRSGDIQLRDFRIWLACHELIARRCEIDAGRKPRFTHQELRRLVGTTAEQHVRSSLNRLETHGMVQFFEEEVRVIPHEVADDPGRPVPVPRPLLRMLARSTGRAFIATTLGHLLRCLFYKRGRCRSGGWCKASWVAEVFEVSMRAVREARARLLSLGVFRMLNADQLRLNRLGRPLVVCLSWVGESAPRRARSTTESAPPREHKKLSYRRVDHQKPARAADPAGARTRAKAPDLNDVTEADLKDPWRLAALFKQARQRGWVTRCRADILAVYAAAVHSLRVATRSAPALFYWTVSRRVWTHASCEDEDRAVAQLATLLDAEPNRLQSQLCE